MRDILCSFTIILLLWLQLLIRLFFVNGCDFFPFVSLFFFFCFRSYCFVLFINVVLLKMCVLVVYAWILFAPVTLQFVCFILFLRFCYVWFFLGSALICFCLVRFIVLQILLRLSKVMRVRVWCVCFIFVWVRDSVDYFD